MYLFFPFGFSVLCVRACNFKMELSPVFFFQASVWKISIILRATSSCSRSGIKVTIYFSCREYNLTYRRSISTALSYETILSQKVKTSRLMLLLVSEREKSSVSLNFKLNDRICWMLNWFYSLLLESIQSASCLNMGKLSIFGAAVI